MKGPSPKKPCAGCEARKQKLIAAVKSVAKKVQHFQSKRKTK